MIPALEFVPVNDIECFFEFLADFGNYEQHILDYSETNHIGEVRT